MYLYLKKLVPAGNGLPENQESWSKFQCKCRREIKSQFESRQKERILPHVTFVLFWPPVPGAGPHGMAWVPPRWGGWPASLGPLR